MAVFKMDPPPETDDVRVLRAYVSDLFEKLNAVLYQIDEDNFSEEFLERLGK